MRSILRARSILWALALATPCTAALAQIASVHEKSTAASASDGGASSTLRSSVAMPPVASPLNPIGQREQSNAMGPAVSPATLSGYRGGSEVRNAILPDGLVQDNQAIHVVTGSNAIREGAFSNASGLPIVIQNTGANVLIQNSTIVNVQFQ